MVVIVYTGLYRFLINRFIFSFISTNIDGTRKTGAQANHRKRHCCVAIATVDRLASNFLVDFHRLKIGSEIIGKLKIG